MEVNLSKQFVGDAVRACSLSSATSSASSSGSRSLDLLGGRFNKRTTVSLLGPGFLSSVNSVPHTEALSSSTASPCQRLELVSRRQGSPKSFRSNIDISNQAPSADAKAFSLIDIEDRGDGSITFKYGAVEDLWDFDRLLEFLCIGAFNLHTAESFVPMVIELFGVQVSLAGQKKMVQMLSSFVWPEHHVNREDMEKMVGQALAEVTSEFLPPSSIGSSVKGDWRPRKRFSSREDKWWNKLDYYLDVGEGSVSVLPEHSLSNFDEFLEQGDFTKAEVSRSSNMEMSEPIWRVAAIEASGLASRTSARPEAGHRMTSNPMESDGNDSFEPLKPDYIGRLGVIIRPLGDHLREREQKENDDTSIVPGTASPSRVEDALQIPIASIQAMMEWEQEETVSSVSLPGSENPRVTFRAKKMTQRTKSKANQRVRGGAICVRMPSNKTTDKPKDPKVCDVFFALPHWHKSSGIASFLAVRKNFSGEMMVILSHVAVGLAAAGLATTLRVGARMLSVNASFDRTKLFGIIRGAALVWLSASMEGLRKAMLHLPPWYTLSDFKDKAQLLYLQQKLRRLSSTAITVMVLVVVGSRF